MTECRSDRFQDYFTLGELLGEGGFASVYKATPKPNAAVELGVELPPVVAVKVIQMKPRQEKGVTVKDFDNEVLALKSIDSEYVLKYYGCWAKTKGPYIQKAYYVMEFIDGVDGFAVLEQGGKLTKGMFSQIIRGLKAIHKAGLAHRDIKLENIMVSNDGKVKLVDFGASCSMTKRCDSNPATTGTAGYQDPLLVYYAKRHPDMFSSEADLKLLSRYQLADYVSLAIAVAVSTYYDDVFLNLHDVTLDDATATYEYLAFAGEYVSSAPYSYDALDRLHDRLYRYVVHAPNLDEADKNSLLRRLKHHKKNYKALLSEAMMDTTLPAPITETDIKRAYVASSNQQNSLQVQNQPPQTKKKPVS